MRNGDAQSAARLPTQKRAFRSDGRLVIGALGSLTHRKGQDVLIDALKLLRDNGINAVVRLGGEGDTKEALRAQAKEFGILDHVEFAGYVNAVDFLSTIDVFCLPSRSEPFGIVLIEAMSQGLPVIATSTDGPSDILANGAGILVPTEDPQSMAAALLELANQPSYSNKLGQAALLRVQED